MLSIRHFSRNNACIFTQQSLQYHTTHVLSVVPSQHPTCKFNNFFHRQTVTFTKQNFETLRANSCKQNSATTNALFSKMPMCIIQQNRILKKGSSVDLQSLKKTPLIRSVSFYVVVTCRFPRRNLRLCVKHLLPPLPQPRRSCEFLRLPLLSIRKGQQFQP